MDGQSWPRQPLPDCRRPGNLRRRVSAKMPLHEAGRGGQLLGPVDCQERARFLQQGDRRRLPRDISGTEGERTHLRKIILPAMQSFEHGCKILRIDAHGGDGAWLSLQFLLTLRQRERRSKPRPPPRRQRTPPRCQPAGRSFNDDKARFGHIFQFTSQVANFSS